ncbi:MAG TPA: glutaredoxin domain-containing protein [Gammaproteobacteria bacterium]
MINPNSSVEIYTSRTCGYCYAAKSALQSHGLKYTEYDVTVDDAKRAEMVRRSGLRTVPQIFIDGQSIGGYRELAKLLAEKAEKKD